MKPPPSAVYGDKPFDDGSRGWLYWSAYSTTVEQYILAAPFNVLCNVGQIFEYVDQIQIVTIQMTAIEHYVLVVQFIMLYKVILTFVYEK